MTTILNLQQVKEWLAGVSPDMDVDVSSSMFDAPFVGDLFAVIGTSSIAVTVTSVDANDATLIGTADLFEQQGTTVKLDFTESDSTLLCTLQVTLPSDVSWTLLPQFSISFEKIVARFTPDVDVGAIALGFTCDVPAGSESIGVEIALPAATGNWVLSTTTPVSITQFKKKVLSDLAGNNALMSLLPKALTKQDFTITGYQMIFSPDAGTCSLIRVAMSHEGDWKFFSDHFTVSSLDFEFSVYPQFGTSGAVQGIVSATMQVGTAPAFTVGAQFPDQVVYAQIAEPAKLDFSEVFTFFGVSPPADFPTVTISMLAFLIDVESETLAFKLAIDEPVPIAGEVSLANFYFDLEATFSGSTATGSGTISGTLAIGDSTVTLIGSYTSGGALSLEGTANNVPIGHLISYLVDTFGVTLPAPLVNLSVETLAVSYTGGTTPSFTFTCNGTLPIAGGDVGFIVTIAVEYENDAFTGTVSAQIILPLGNGETLTLDVTFTTTSTATIMTVQIAATQALNIAGIAAVFGFPIDGIPPALDLSLTGASLSYNFTIGALAFGGQSGAYDSSAAFVSILNDGTRIYELLLAIGESFDLSDLPVVGSTFAAIEEINVSNLLIVGASASTDATAAAAINAIIATLGTGFPTVPANGLPEGFYFSGAVSLGSTSLPMVVPLEGGGAVSGGGGGGTGPTQWINVQRSFGPISIQRIGGMYQVQQQTLWFEIDATLTVGPFSLSLDGLGIGAPLSTFDPQFMLSGIGIAYDNPPLVIAGALINTEPPGSATVSYEGALTIATGNFTAIAFGYYGNAGGTMMFAFGDLIFPIGGPPALFVTGAALGIGYNSAITMPGVDEVASFPFVEVLASTSPFDPSDPAEEILGTLTGGTPAWIAFEQNSFWIVAGLSFTSFSTVQSQALLMVQAGNELVIGLVGMSVAQWPQQTPGGALITPYALLELDFDITLVPAQGEFSMQALIGDGSYLISSACVPTGGFAFDVWFGDNPASGDFVLTLGGYNPGFTPPAYYPNVPPLGFTWNVDSSTTISGSAYLAFTPAVLMIGGTLGLTYQSGNLQAWLTAHADMVVQWKPFWFDVLIGVTVGASYTADLFFTTSTFSTEVGCTVELYGPPTGGTLTVSWTVISFSISFGAAKAGAPTLGWSDVQAMLPNAPDVLTIGAVAGLTPVTSTPADGASWIARGGLFAFLISTPIPATTLTVGETFSFNGQTFNIAPLGSSGISSTVTITIEDSNGDDMSSAFSVTPAYANAPSSLWGPIPPASGPAVPVASGQLLANELLGIGAQVNEPALGETAGPVQLSTFATVSLSTDGTIPLSATAAGAGDGPSTSAGTVEVIEDPASGIAAPSILDVRDAILAALAGAGYAPVTGNASMSDFANEAGTILVAQPLLVAA